MRLYATTTSERASKGQGGNEFLFSDYTFLEKRLSKLRVYIKNDGFITHFIIHFAGEKPLINSYGNDGEKHGISLQDIKKLEGWAIAQSIKPFNNIKGKRQKGE